MKNYKLPAILTAVGVIAFGLSLTGSAFAAFNYVSDNYVAQMDVKSIGVTLTENGNDISWRNYNHRDDSWSEASGELLTTLLSDAGDAQLILNKKYNENLAVRNSGTIDEYVRVDVYHYWIDDETGEKRTDLDPDLIHVHFTNDGWLEDTSAATTERNVFYYSSILESGETTTDFVDYIQIDGDIAKIVSETRESYTENGVTYTTITLVYEYDGATFVLRADVDAVQTHNAKEAIYSAWGIDVDIAADGTLSLK